MKLPSERTQTAIQTWDFLIGLTRDTGLPDAVQQEVHWLLRHYPRRHASDRQGTDGETRGREQSRST